MSGDAAGRLALSGNAVDLWFAVPEAIGDPSLLDAYRGLLPQDERARVDRLVFEEDRRDALVARALVRTTLARYLGEDPAALRFEVQRHGRPELAGDPAARPLRFNLSHARGLVAVAVTRRADVGVDVERADRPVERALAHRFFAPAEIAALDALGDAAFRDRFFDLWCLKEAYIKARGLGLRIPLDRFAFEVSTGGGLGFHTDPALDDPAPGWWFLLLHPAPGLRAAAALRWSDARAPCWTARRVAPLLEETSWSPPVLAVSSEPKPRG